MGHRPVNSFSKHPNQRKEKAMKVKTNVKGGSYSWGMVYGGQRKEKAMKVKTNVKAGGYDIPAHVKA
jgi:hypothetical protein